jgi:hypothetical protein
MYENETMRLVETILRRGKGTEGTMEGVNLMKIYCTHFCKYHNVPQVQQYYANKNKLNKFIRPTYYEDIKVCLLYTHFQLNPNKTILRYKFLREL